MTTESWLSQSYLHHVPSRGSRSYKHVEVLPSPRALSLKKAGISWNSTERTPAVVGDTSFPMEISDVKRNAESLQEAAGITEKLAGLRMTISRLVRRTSSAGRWAATDGKGESRGGVHAVGGAETGGVRSPPGGGIGSGPLQDPRNIRETGSPGGQSDLVRMTGDAGAHFSHAYFGVNFSGREGNRPWFRDDFSLRSVPQVS